MRIQIPNPEFHIPHLNASGGNRTHIAPKGGRFTGGPAAHRTSEGEPTQWHEWESNPQSPRFELGRSAGWRTVPRWLLVFGRWSVRTDGVLGPMTASS